MAEVWATRTGLTCCSHVLTCPYRLEAHKRDLHGQHQAHYIKCAVCCTEKKKKKEEKIKCINLDIQSYQKLHVHTCVWKCRSSAWQAGDLSHSNFVLDLHFSREWQKGAAVSRANEQESDRPCTGSLELWIIYKLGCHVTTSGRTWQKHHTATDL